jgi:cellobiose phosphorylase
MTGPTKSAGLIMRGKLVEAIAEQAGGFWDTIGSGLRISAPQESPLAPAAERAGEIFPWFIHNALVHYLSPRGLEQYSGGGWGTRDVCQGPVELLLALGRFEPIRDLLVRVFRQQNPDGDWPQWFMFFERERNIRPGDSHGDIVYWPLLALAQYLAATGDASLLDETLPFFHLDEDAAAETATIWQHVERALDLIRHRVIEGTSLAAYGHGDWNDSLQPAKPDMRDRLCSSWTVTLNHQTCVALAAAFRHLGNAERAGEFEAMAARILEEFQRVLIADGVLAGLAYFHEGGKTEHLLHPRDTTTGLSYSLLPMIHAIINDMFSPAQAEAHLGIIREHLLGPDGARLFDRPMAYQGGIQTNFQRAESASYFGREIGIMYMHAHLRYCEALARFGDADGFFHALGQLNPIAIRELVPSATSRQANCYYSSSDAAFADRYEAFAEYDKVKSGEVALEGGWRVYSSGAGISTRLIMQCFLGLRVEKSALIVDPVIAPELDGLTASLNLAGRAIEVLYRTGKTGRGPRSIDLNGTSLVFVRESNPYRTAGVRIPMESWARCLIDGNNRLTITLE